MLYEYSLRTGREGFYPITSQVRDAVKKSGVSEGIAVVYCPHTTAAITVNENADPDVVTDLIFAYNKTFPDRREFLHAEGNSAAHLRSSCTGISETLIISDSKLLLGTWQGVYFAEFDGPRSRRFFVKILEG